MKIGLYFGSFNPIHIGHLIIAEFIQQHTTLDQVWFVISPQNPFKKKTSLLNSYHRLHLAHLAIGENPHLQASDIEFKLPVPSYTIDTLVYLKEKHPEHHYKVIVGSDSFQNIGNWKNGDVLLRDYSFIVYERPGFLIKSSNATDYQIVKAPLLEISSTYIREQIKAGKSIRYLVPEPVFSEIVNNRYYQ